VSGSRTDYWLKFKNYRIETFHIGGFHRKSQPNRVPAPRNFPGQRIHLCWPHR
jgi:hypothetical protein